jgi:hypothetical protein
MRLVVTWSEKGGEPMTISPDDGMRQAMDTAHDYMLRAKSDVAKIFGESAALKYPELIHAHMNAAALDFLAYSVLRHTDRSEESLTRINDRLEELVAKERGE